MVMYLVMTRRYSSLGGLSSSSCGGLLALAEAFLPFGQKKGLICCFTLFQVIFGCSVVTSVTLSNKLSSFEKKSKKSKKKSRKVQQIK